METDDWVTCGLPFDARNQERSFTSDLGRANLPGVLVEVNGQRYLIGHINDIRGVCDDCTEFGMDAIVTRYKRVWSAPGSGAGS